MIEKRHGSRGRGTRNGKECQKKNVLVMKSNKNVNVPYCAEYLSVNSGGVALVI